MKFVNLHLICRKKRAEVQKELEEAAAEIKTVNLGAGVSASVAPPADMAILSSLAVSCVIPTQASHKFVRYALVLIF